MFEKKNTNLFPEKLFAVYLSGNIKKSHDLKSEQSSFWSKTEKTELCKGLSPHKCIFLDPSKRNDDINDSLSVLGRDYLMVLISDAVLVDGRETRGVGVGAEIDRAETQNIPIVSIIPKNSPYHKFDTQILGQKIAEYKHPFAYELADYVAENFEQAGKWLTTNIVPRVTFEVKTVNKKILIAMYNYLCKQFEHDSPLKNLYDLNPTIKNRIDHIKEICLLELYENKVTKMKNF